MYSSGYHGRSGRGNIIVIRGNKTINEDVKISDNYDDGCFDRIG